MARLARVVAVDVAHHVTQRGNARQYILNSDGERMVYLDLLRQSVQLHSLSVIGYCLMSNHVHLVVIPRKATAMAKALKEAHGRYATYWNAAHASSGHAWQGRFYSCPLDTAHLWEALRYAELNPVRAGLVARAQEWKWSSAAAHCGLRDDILLSDDFPPPGVIADWSEWLRIEHTEEDLKAIRKHLSTGRPWGSPDFIQQLEALTGRSLQLRRVGRPKKIPGPTGSSLFPEGEK